MMMMMLMVVVVAGDWDEEAAIDEDSLWDMSTQCDGSNGTPTDISREYWF